MSFRTLAAVTASLLALAACVRAPEPPPAPPPTPSPRPVPAQAPPPPSSSDWRDWPVTPGTWTYRADARGSVAMFGQAGADARFVVRCDQGQKAIHLSQPGDARPAGMTIRTSTTARTVAAQPTGGAPPYVAATLGAGDSLLDAIGYSRGRFVVEAPPLATLVIPAWPEILRVVEDCRG